MKLFPAIDLYNGQCVRLEKGVFETATTFSSNPLTIALTYQNEGAEWIHVIDLNGAQTGESKNIEVIKQIVQKTSLKIQVGGGIRDESKIKRLLDLGVDRVILGSYAVNDTKKLKELTKTYPNKIIVSVDSKDGFVTFKGWQETSTKTTISFCKELESVGINTIVYTDISKDGMMSGPNFDDYKEIQSHTLLNVIASGGVSSYSDIKKLKHLKLYGAIIGKALYLGKMTVKEMIRCLLDESYPV